MHDTNLFPKICNLCKQPFPATTEYFHRHKKNKDGLTNACKSCAKARAAKWYVDNPEQAAKSRTEYQKTHKDEHNAINKRYYARLGEKGKQLKRKHRHDSYYRDLEKSRKNQRLRAHARRVAGGVTIKQSDIDLQYRSQKGKCWHCGKELNGKFHIDHLIPIVRGGGNQPENLVISCQPCNNSKSSKTTMEWNGRLF